MAVWEEWGLTPTIAMFLNGEDISMGNARGKTRNASVGQDDQNLRSTDPELLKISSFIYGFRDVNNQVEFLQWGWKSPLGLIGSYISPENVPKLLPSEYARENFVFRSGISLFVLNPKREFNLAHNAYVFSPTSEIGRNSGCHEISVTQSQRIAPQTKRALLFYSGSGEQLERFGHRIMRRRNHELGDEIVEGAISDCCFENQPEKENEELPNQLRRW